MPGCLHLVIPGLRGIARGHGIETNERKVVQEGNEEKAERKGKILVVQSLHKESGMKGPHVKDLPDRSLSRVFGRHSRCHWPVTIL